MKPIEITLKLPEDYVEDAADFDMLAAEDILRVLREELDQRIMAFVDAEVKAHRSAQKDEQD